MEAISRLESILKDCFSESLDENRIKFITTELESESEDHLNKLCKEIIVRFDYTDPITTRDVFFINETVKKGHITDFSGESEVCASF